jgi:hypothetical protein
MQEIKDVAWIHLKFSIVGSRAFDERDSKFRQISITAGPAPSLRAVSPGALGLAEFGHIAATGRNGLASKCGDDKDAIAGICSHFREGAWLLSTRSA